MPTQLPGIFSLIGSGFEIYQRRLGVVLSISLINVVIVGALSTLILLTVPPEALEGKQVALSSSQVTTLLISVLITAFVSLITAFALIHAIRGADEMINVGEAFKRAWRQFGSLLWVGIITFFVVLGATTLAALPGAALFFAGQGGLGLGIFAVLCVVLMVLVATWLCFTNFVVVDGVEKGVNALLMSKEMVRGRFWKILFRVFVLSVILGLIVAILGTILEGVAGKQWGGMAGQAISMLFFTPIFIASFYTLYRSVKMSSPVAPELRGRGWIMGLGILGIVGIIALPLFGGYAFLTYVKSQLEGATGQPTNVEITVVQVALEVYYNENNRYPAKLTDASKELGMFAASVDLRTFTYTPGSDGKSYKLCQGDTCVQIPR